MTIYYTYCSYETDKGHKGLAYIGSRKCPEGLTPETDNYFGSPKSKKNKKFRDNPNKDKVILGVFDSSEEALAHEIYLHDFYDVAVNPQFANQAKQTSTGFSWQGKKHSSESCSKISESLSGEKNPNFGKRGKETSRFGKTSPNFGKVLSKEKRENLSKINTGEGNPNFDSNLYNFHNEVLGLTELNITRCDMANKHGLNRRNIGSIVRGGKESPQELENLLNRNPHNFSALL